MPVFNGERHLAAAIESILGQTCQDLELVVSDNASSDATPEICQDYADADPRVRYTRLDRNVGARMNFEIVLSRARGEWFKWSAHDDLIRPEFLAGCLARLDHDRGAVLCATDIEVIDDRGEQLGETLQPITIDGRTPHERLRQFFAHPKVHQTIFGVIRRSVLDSTDLLGPWFGSDRELLMELALRGRFHRVDQLLFLHREHPGRSDHVPSKVAYYTPERGDRPVAQHWRHLGRAARALLSAPMPAAERARCLAEYGRRGRTLVGRWAPTMCREAATSVRTMSGFRVRR
ncbi:MAG TPA: glycosyltransferase [Intrasporangium sp.]|uniref:glycosyltransferase family 2 protein n=1 Tax=Intrasporangium sp. TaxID=1925024 RepID=UPI002B48A4AB|nr:glycosyltransferase [Intrasporangium sp.]HKX67497.1 glycosyltransferase [Intrasporangium sp.]